MFLYFKQMQFVDSNSAIVLFFFPRLMFGHFHDALVKSRDAISSRSGVVEALSYKILVYPDTLLNGTFQDNRQGICVISFDTSTEAHEWLSTDQLVTMRDRWSYGREVNVVLVNLALSRHYPFSLCKL
ncbi:uncharacterized protein LOC117341158 [Pecten maximus]|uniref:uncharacterized protein LOC117341158 n=1 Tax=Pecten maximus TaxID=6579 RepID=UPI001458CD58|nr:uncharacterized protein LOC117341158 [Pecten maximus]